MRARTYEAGFTLIELLVATVLLGILIASVGPTIRAAFTYMDGVKRSENTVSNQKLASALLSFARNSNDGSLPAPYTGNGVRYGLFNPNDSSAGAALAMELRNTGVPINAINSDSSVVKNARVYQRVAGLQYSMPFYVSTGSQVILTYDVGVIVQTQCPVADACYSSGIPGDSQALTAANVTTWNAEGTDYAPIAFSTLPEQKNMLRLTTGRVNRLTDKLASEFYVRMRQAAANSTTNFFPRPTNAGAPNLAGLNPVANMGCHDGWYRLNAANVNVLSQLGLEPSEYGSTAWGGSIEYCRDYEPTAVNASTANSAPHYAALRINRNLSLALAPTASAADIVITF